MSIPHTILFSKSDWTFSRRYKKGFVYDVRGKKKRKTHWNLCDFGDFRGTTLGRSGQLWEGGGGKIGHRSHEGSYFFPCKASKKTMKYPKVLRASGGISCFSSRPGWQPWGAAAPAPRIESPSRGEGCQYLTRRARKGWWPTPFRDRFGQGS